MPRPFLLAPGLPARRARNLAAVAVAGVFLCDLGDFDEQACIEGNRLKTEADEAAVFDMEFVGSRLFSRVVQMLDRNTSQSRNQIGDLDDSECFRHLIEDANPFVL